MVLVNRFQDYPSIPIHKIVDLLIKRLNKISVQHTKEVDEEYLLYVFAKLPVQLCIVNMSYKFYDFIKLSIYHKKNYTKCENVIRKGRYLKNYEKSFSFFSTYSSTFNLYSKPNSRDKYIIEVNCSVL